MKARNVVALIPTIILLLLSIPSIVLFSGIPTIDATIVNGNCDPSYPDTCIPSPPPDLDCGEISDKRFQVVPPDPHGFSEEGWRVLKCLGGAVLLFGISRSQLEIAADALGIRCG